MDRTDIQFSVVVPTCARHRDLAACLERLGPGRQTAMNLVPPDTAVAGQLGGNYEVIVTDDGVAATAEAMMRERFPWARWVAGPCRGPAANRNHGARRARGSWLVFTDDDCLPEPGWLAAFVAGMRPAPGNAQVLEGRTRAIGGKPHPLAQCPVNETGGCLWSCNFAIARELFADLGGFDERFPHAALEDMELNLRLQKRGVRQLFVPEALVYHPWKDVRFLAHMRRLAWSQLLLRELHPEQRKWISLGMHLRRVVGFYLHELPAGFGRFGWRQLSCLPLQFCNQAQTAAIYLWHALGRGPVPGAARSAARPALTQS